MVYRGIFLSHTMAVVFVYLYQVPPWNLARLFFIKLEKTGLSACSALARTRVAKLRRAVRDHVERSMHLSRVTPGDVGSPLWETPSCVSMQGTFSLIANCGWHSLFCYSGVQFF